MTLDELLSHAFPSAAPQHPHVDVEWIALIVFARLVLAFALGGLVGIIYRLTARIESSVTPSFVSTIVLLAVIIAMVTQVVGDQLGRAFTLVGALSIVRFRTVVEDTRDTAFVIFAVVVGMACGMGNLLIAVVGFAVVTSAAFVLYMLQKKTHAVVSEWVLQIRISTGAGTNAPWEATLAAHCDFIQLESTATARQGAAVDVTYKLHLKPTSAPLALMSDINRLEGIQNLELKRA